LATRFGGRFVRAVTGVLATVIVVATAEAQAPQGPVTIGTSSGDVTVIADQMEQLGPDNLLIATGNVELTKGGTRLMADRIELNRATGDAVALGHVIFYDGEDQLTGQRIEYNVNTGTGVVYQADAHSAPYYRISGERMDRLGESVYSVSKGVFTTCDADPPDWSFHFGSGTVNLNEFIYGTGASFWVRNLPLIPFFPGFAAAIRRDRQTGFLFPKYGYSTTKGAYAEVPFFWAIDESQDMTISPLVYTNRGEGGHLEYRYVVDPIQRGRFSGFFLQESFRHDSSRFLGTTQQQWVLPFPRTTLKVDMAGVSDDHVLSDYGDALAQRSSQRVESNVFVTRSWDTWNAVGNLFFYQDLTTKRPTELNRLPDIRAVGTAQPLHDLPGVLWQFEGSAVNFVRDVGSNGGRIDLHPQILRPIPLDIVTLTPMIGGRLTGYSKTVTGISSTQQVNGTIESTDDEPRLRRLLEAGATLESKLTRVFNTGGFWNTDALLHSIEPQVTYLWIAGKDKNNLPQWTPALDAIEDSSVVQYTLTNRIRGRTIPLANTEPVRWEMFRLTLTNSYDLKRQQPQDAMGTLIVSPRPGTTFRSDLTYSIVDGNFPSVTADVSTRVPLDGQVNLGYRFSDPGKFTFVQGGFNINPFPWLTARGLINWDVRTPTFTESRLAVELHWQCWALVAEYIQRTRRDDEVRFTLNLLGVGAPISTNVGLGAVEGGRTR
jgi:LPS-assembly protein